jgi:hypothetical protein
MTKKHFEAAAKRVREMQFSFETGNQQRYDIKLRVANEFAEFFTEFNPRFNEETFFAACLPKSE